MVTTKRITKEPTASGQLTAVHIMLSLSLSDTRTQADTSQAPLCSSTDGGQFSLHSPVHLLVGGLDIGKLLRRRRPLGLEPAQQLMGFRLDGRMTRRRRCFRGGGDLCERTSER